MKKTILLILYFLLHNVMHGMSSSSANAPRVAMVQGQLVVTQPQPSATPLWYNPATQHPQTTATATIAAAACAVTNATTEIKEIKENYDTRSVRQIKQLTRAAIRHPKKADHNINLLQAVDIPGLNQMPKEVAQIILEQADFRPLLFPQALSVCQEFSRFEHNLTVNDARYIPALQKFLTAGDDGVARLWELKDNKATMVAAFRHNDKVKSASYIPELKLFLTTNADYTIRLWQLDEQNKGREVACFTHNGPIISATYIPALEQFLTASNDCTVRIWKLGDNYTPQQIAILNHEYPVTSAEYVPATNHYLTKSHNCARLWAFDNNNTIQEIAKVDHIGTHGMATYVPSHNLFISTGVYDAKIWKVGTSNTPELIATLQHEIPEGFVKSAAYIPEHDAFLTRSSGPCDPTTRLWTIDKNNKPQEFARFTHNTTTQSAQFIPERHQFITASWDKTARLWALDANKNAQELIRFVHPGKFPEAGVESAEYIPERNQFLTRSKNTVHVWNDPIPPRLTNNQVALLLMLKANRRTLWPYTKLNVEQMIVLNTFDEAIKNNLIAYYGIQEESEQKMCACTIQ